MKLKTIFENTAFDYNSITNAYIITANSEKSIDLIKGLLKSTNDKEKINHINDAVTQLENTPKLLDKYVKSADINFDTGDFNLFVNLSHNVYNTLEAFLFHFPNE